MRNIIVFHAKKKEEDIDFSKIPELFELPQTDDLEELKAEKEKSYDVLRTLLAIEAVCGRIAEKSDNKEEAQRDNEGDAAAHRRGTAQVCKAVQDVR